MNDAIAQLIRERGLLLERELFDLLNKFSDLPSAKVFLDGLERVSGQKMITSSSLTRNVSFVHQLVNVVPGDLKLVVQNTFVKMGISFEILQETKPLEPVKEDGLSYKLFYADTKNNKKIEVSDFVGHFRSRYQQLQRILMHKPELQQNLFSINKLPSVRQKASIIGILTEKRTTGNKNLILTFEDLTGKMSALVKTDSECFSKAKELQLDDIVGVKGVSNKEMMYVQDIIWPDSFKEKTKFDNDVCVAFVSDIHVGSAKHLGSEFMRFLEWINSEDELAKKIKYIFFVGDNIDGVGIFPGQERLLTLKSMKDQYAHLAQYIKAIPSHITMFMCPGQHDSVRVAEPQPIIDSIYGKPLYDIPNLVLVSNPTTVKLLEKDKEFTVLMYHGASIHAFINEIEELRTLKAHRCPAKAVKHMLKRRHLAPSHGVSASVVYVPNNKHDPLVISDVPDVLCTGEVHRLDIENYNGTLIITGSCWQAQTEFEEKVGNVPDPCKVPVLNLKTRELKILDFTGT
jgi:DNA polymerase II small subunit